MRIGDGLLLRGMRWRLGASVLTVLTATIAVATAVLGPLYLHTAGDSQLRRTVAAAPVQDSGVSVLPFSDRSNPLVAVKGAERTVLRAGGARPWFSAPLTTVMSGVELASGKSQLFARTGICHVLHFLQGGCDLARGKVVMTKGGAAKQGVSLGGLVLARVQGQARPLHLRVSGIVSTPNLSLPYWWGDGPSDFPLGLSLGSIKTAPSTDPLITSQATALAVPPQDVPSAIGQLPLRSGAVTLANENDFKRGVRRTEAALRTRGIQTGTQLPTLLAHADHQRHAMTTIVAIAAIQLVLLAIWVLASLLIRTSDARRSEARVARLRGFPGPSMLWVTAAEPGVLCVLGAFLGVAVAWLTIVVARNQLFVHSAVIAFDGWTFLALALTLVAIAGALGLGAMRLLRSGDPAERGPRTPAEASQISRVADAVLIVLAIVALVALDTTGTLNGHANPLASAAPGLLALGTAVVAVQLILFSCRLGISLTPDSSRVGLFLALRQTARRPGVLRQARVLIIALCLACFAAATWSVARSNRSTVAHFEVGAHTVVTVAPQPADRLQRAVDRVDPRGRFAMAAIDLHTPSTTLLAVDAPRLTATTSWPHGISTRSLQSVSRTLDAPSAPIAQLPGAPIRVVARVAEIGTRAHVHLGMWVFSGTGGTTVVDLGALRDGARTYVGDTADVCHGGCRLEGFGILPAPGEALPTRGLVKLKIASVQSRLPSGVGRALPTALFTDGWRSSTAGVRVQDTGAGLELTATAGAIAAKAGATGSSSPPMALPGHPQVLPAVVTSELQSLQAGPPGPLPIQGLDGNTISARHAVTASALPRVGSDAIMVDLGLISRLQVGPTATGATDEVWLGPHAPADAIARLSAAGLEPLAVQRSSDVFEALQRSGPALADDFLLAATIAALLIATASTLAALGATTRERATELASLEVAGIPRPTLLRGLGLETVILILTALCGTVAGAVAAGLAIPALPELAAASFAPLNYGLPAGVIAAVSLVVVAAVGLAAAVIAVILVRRMSPTLLRTVADDISG